MRMRMFGCMYACAYANTYVLQCMYLHVSKRRCLLPCTYVCNVRIYIRMHVCIYVYNMYAYVSVRVFMYANIYECM